MEVANADASFPLTLQRYAKLQININIRSKVSQFIKPHIFLSIKHCFKNREYDVCIAKLHIHVRDKRFKDNSKGTVVNENILVWATVEKCSLCKVGGGEQ